MKVTVLGKFGIVMADPPWKIEMDLPYRLMQDDEMLSLPVAPLTDDVGELKNNI